MARAAIQRCVPGLERECGFGFARNGELEEKGFKKRNSQRYLGRAVEFCPRKSGLNGGGLDI